MKRNLICIAVAMLAGNFCLAQVPQQDTSPSHAPVSEIPLATAASTSSTQNVPVKTGKMETETTEKVRDVTADSDETKDEAKEVLFIHLKHEAAETEKVHESVSSNETTYKEREQLAAKQANMAVDLMEQGYDELAEKKFSHALQLDPNLASAYCNLALIDQRAGNLDAAFMNMETCFIKGFKDFEKLEKDKDFSGLVSDRRYRALKQRYR